MVGERRSEEAFATMRGYLAATALSLLSGCVAVEERPAPYEDLRSDLHGVRNEMAAASQAVAQLARRGQGPRCQHQSPLGRHRA